MSRTAEITRAAMFVESEGNLYTVNLPHEQMIFLCNVAATLSNSGALPLVKLPEGFEFTTIGDLNDK